MTMTNEELEAEASEQRDRIIFLEGAVDMLRHLVSELREKAGLK